jgi:hypothetical protein
MAGEPPIHWHALLAYVDSAWMITDLGSRNGTWLNGWRRPGTVPLLPVTCSTSDATGSSSSAGPGRAGATRRTVAEPLT